MGESLVLKQLSFKKSGNVKINNFTTFRRSQGQLRKFDALNYENIWQGKFPDLCYYCFYTFAMYVLYGISTA